MIQESAVKDIVKQIIQEMDLGAVLNEASLQNVTEVQPTGCEAAEAGEIPDEAAVDLRQQYLIENPRNKEAYMAIKVKAPCRLGIGKAGARYKTDPTLQFRAAHSAAQDAVFTDVGADFVENQLGFFTVQSRCENKDVYLTRPDLGRQLSEEAKKIIAEKCKKHPKVQLVVADGLSSAAIEANAGEVYPAIVQGLESQGIDVGTPFFVKYGRVAIMEEIAEIVEPEAICVLIGERPGLITAQSMSAYMAYHAEKNMPEARRNVVSNIHKEGTNPAEAGAHIADVLKMMLDQKKSGTDLKL